MKGVPIKTLSDLVESGVIQLTRGKVISKRDIAACPGTFPIYSSAKKNDGKFGEYGKYLFDEELITWSVDGGGNLFHRPKHKFSVTNVGGILRIRDRNVLDYRYLYHILSLRHSEIRFDWVRKAHPSVIEKLYRNIPLPPLPEQRRIVSILDEAFEGIATAKANAEKNLQNARALFESHVQSIFGQRDEGWVDSTLNRIATNLDRQRVPITKKDRTSGEYPYYGASGIVDYVGDYIFEGDTLLVSEDGANLLARSTPIAFSVSGKYWVNNHAHILKFENMATQRFVEFYLESIKLDEYITGAAQPKLNQRALNSIPIPIPESVDAQLRIVECVESVQDETRRLAAVYERKLDALEALKKSLLHQAFTGQLGARAA